MGGYDDKRWFQINHHQRTHRCDPTGHNAFWRRVLTSLGLFIWCRIGHAACISVVVFPCCSVCVVFCHVLPCGVMLRLHRSVLLLVVFLCCNNLGQISSSHVVERVSSLCLERSSLPSPYTGIDNLLLVKFLEFFCSSHCVSTHQQQPNLPAKQVCSLKESVVNRGRFVRQFHITSPVFDCSRPSPMPNPDRALMMIMRGL